MEYYVLPTYPRKPWSKRAIQLATAQHTVLKCHTLIQVQKESNKRLGLFLETADGSLKDRFIDQRTLQMRKEATVKMLCTACGVTKVLVHSVFYHEDFIVTIEMCLDKECQKKSPYCNPLYNRVVLRRQGLHKAGTKIFEAQMLYSEEKERNPGVRVVMNTDRLVIFLRSKPEIVTHSWDSLKKGDYEGKTLKLYEKIKGFGLGYDGKLDSVFLENNDLGVLTSNGLVRMPGRPEASKLHDANTSGTFEFSSLLRLAKNRYGAVVKVMPSDWQDRDLKSSILVFDKKGKEIDRLDYRKIETDRKKQIISISQLNRKLIIALNKTSLMHVVLFHRDRLSWLKHSILITEHQGALNPDIVVLNRNRRRFIVVSQHSKSLTFVRLTFS